MACLLFVSWFSSRQGGGGGGGGVGVGDVGGGGFGSDGGGVGVVLRGHSKQTQNCHKSQPRKTKIGDNCLDFEVDVIGYGRISCLGMFFMRFLLLVYS